MIPTVFRVSKRKSLSTTTGIVRRFAATMIGDPDVVQKSRESCSHCHGEKSHCRCSQGGHVIPISQLISRPSQLPHLGLANQSKLLAVEGNIGVGKTTLAKKLANALGYKLFLEPTTENPYLGKFYADPYKFALKLQLWILHQRYTTYVEAVQHTLKTDQGVILDRSVYSDCIFANVCTNEGYISTEGYKEYQYWRERCLEFLPPPHITIFLDASPQCCYDRIQSRARDCESGVTLDYLEKLHEQYLEFIDQLRSQSSCVFKYDWSIFKGEKIVCDAVEDTDTTTWTHSHLLTDDRIIRNFGLLESS